MKIRLALIVKDDKIERELQDIVRAFSSRICYDRNFTQGIKLDTSIVDNELKVLIKYPFNKPPLSSDCQANDNQHSSIQETDNKQFDNSIATNFKKSNSSTIVNVEENISNDLSDNNIVTASIQENNHIQELDYNQTESSNATAYKHINSNIDATSIHENNPILKNHNLKTQEDNVIKSNDDSLKEYTFSYNLSKSELLNLKKTIKEYSKIALYTFLCSITDITLPYGSLTGIRPTKLYYDMDNEKIDTRNLIDKYKVSEKKYNIIQEIVNAQAGIYNKEREKINLFINIPICISRCSYCSFVSSIRSQLKEDIIKQYIDCLIMELEDFYKLYNSSDIRSIYIGGGTPTALSEMELEQLLKSIDIKRHTEFTLEAGRPDTITDKKLDIMSRYSVNRISINPQTFNNNTLKNIGRLHSVEDTIKAYNLASEYGFIINMDMIAALPSESTQDFSLSMDKLIKLKPHNITVHTLALKRGSSLKTHLYDNNQDDNAHHMTDYAYNCLKNAGYKPYYMYRLKNMSGNLENIGYAIDGYQCVYNVDIMEETHSIYAIGAGGISKKITDSSIERLSESKDIYYYLNNYDNLRERKKKFFTNL